MNVFKRLAELEKQNASLALALAEQAKAISTLEKRLEEAMPGFEEQRVDIELFEKGVNNILLFDANSKGGEA